MSDDATEMMKWYGWANFHTTEEVAAMLHKQAVEIARLRSVCMECSRVLMRQYDKMTLEQVQQLPWLSAAIVTVAQDMGACGDGQSLENTSNG